MCRIYQVATDWQYFIDTKDKFPYLDTADNYQSIIKVKGDLCMKKIMIAVVVALFAIGLAFAPFAVATPQQDKMKACNKEATEKKLAGEERKAFMSECLKTKPATTPQQEKMKVCNKEANEKNLKGEERQKFMKECLKAKPAAATTQQDKMKACNKEATEKKLTGEARKKFMSDCLSAK